MQFAELPETGMLEDILESKAQHHTYILGKCITKHREQSVSRRNEREQPRLRLSGLTCLILLPSHLVEMTSTVEWYR